MKKSHTKLQIHLRQMILAIENAVSLVGMNDANHGKRVGFIASQLGAELNASNIEQHYLFDLGLLHDCGVSTEQMHADLVNHFDYHDAHVHCEIGYNLLKNFEPLADFANPILYHHTPWQDLQNQYSQGKLSEADIWRANIIFLSDRVDVLSFKHYGKDILFVRDDVMATIEHYEGTYFNPEFVAAFRRLKNSEAFWITLQERHITRYTWEMGVFDTSKLLGIDQVKQLSLILAYVVDQKSPFTTKHSARVASLAKYLAQQLNLSSLKCDKIEIAGLLHDLGKLRIPDAILEKKGALTEMERSIMNQHSYETFEIIRNIKGLEDIALWSAFHHERIDGHGYPFHPAEADFSLEARIIAVADIFQALAQDRPYRAGLPLEDIIQILDECVDEGKIDHDIVMFIKENKQTCFSIASALVDANDLNPMFCLVD